MTLYPTGDQYEIAFESTSAVITEVGATLRAFAVDGNDVVRGFAADEAVHKGRGQQLLPWPNRIRDGRYTFGGETHQLALSEPERNNAIHGLVRSVPWRLVEQTTSSITQQVTVFPQVGWTGIVTATIKHTLSAEGLRVEVAAENVGNEAVPFGYAAHPYLTVGEAVVDDVAVTLPAASYLEVDERLLPIAVREVAGTDKDLRAGKPLGDTNLDTAFTDLIRDDDGLWRVKLAYGGRTATLWGDETYGWIQVFTGDTLRDMSLAVEPMTCGPDAFNDGPTADGMITLQPGETYRGTWGISGGAER